ncbi:MAG: hypothetical protein HOV96_31005 [Nonomuraea sp.]|nr:hypothetical protein [Nonomuraea sp.]NUP81977.1 hypothetical protein [Nonomuraea sp.]
MVDVVAQHAVPARGQHVLPGGSSPELSDPLTKDKPGNQPKNRNVFSRSFKAGTTSYASTEPLRLYWRP